MKLPITLTHAQRRNLIVLAKMLTPLFFILIIAGRFHEFITHAVEANIAINLGIIVAAGYGVALILLRLKSAMSDFNIIERFGHEARNGQDMKVLLEQPWLKSRYVRHYLQHIANTGGNLTSQMDQNAIENELHALQDEYSNKLELPQFLVGFMIAMGLLGTFIGLLETLTGISGMLDGLSASGTDVQAQFMKLVVELRKPLAGMGIAFSASMFGLITSLTLAIMMTNLRRYIGRVISLARNVMHELTVMTAGVAPAPVAGKVIEVQSAANVSSVSSTMLVGRFDILSRKIETILVAFEDSIKSTQRMIDLLSFGPRMKETSEKSLEELKLISVKNTDFNKLMQRMIEVNTDVVKTSQAVLDVQKQSKSTNDSILLALKGVATNMNEQYQISKQAVDIDTTLARTASDIFMAQKQNVEFRDVLLTGLKSIVDSHADQKALIQSLIDLSGGTVRTLGETYEGQTQSRLEANNGMQNLISNISKIEEVNIGGARHLWDIKEKLTKLSDNLSVIDLIASSVGGQTALLETLVDEMRISNKTSGNENGETPDMQIPVDGSEMELQKG